VCAVQGGAAERVGRFNLQPARQQHLDHFHRGFLGGAVQQRETSRQHRQWLLRGAKIVDQRSRNIGLIVFNRLDQTGRAIIAGWGRFRRLRLCGLDADDAQDKNGQGNQALQDTSSRGVRRLCEGGCRAMAGRAGSSA
jgi:hypothetical protein